MAHASGKLLSITGFFFLQNLKVPTIRGVLHLLIQHRDNNALQPAVQMFSGHCLILSSYSRDSALTDTIYWVEESIAITCKNPAVGSSSLVEGPEIYHTSLDRD